MKKRILTLSSKNSKILNPPLRTRARTISIEAAWAGVDAAKDAGQAAWAGAKAARAAAWANLLLAAVTVALAFNQTALERTRRRENSEESMASAIIVAREGLSNLARARHDAFNGLSKQHLLQHTQLANQLISYVVRTPSASKDEMTALVDSLEVANLIDMQIRQVTEGPETVREQIVVASGFFWKADYDYYWLGKELNILNAKRNKNWWTLMFDTEEQIFPSYLSTKSLKAFCQEGRTPGFEEHQHYEGYKPSDKTPCEGGRLTID